MKRPMLSIQELSRDYKISSSTVRRLILSGKLPCQKVRGQWRFDPELVKEAFDKGLLAGTIGGELMSTNYLEPVEKLEWADRMVRRCRNSLTEYIEKMEPDHVVVNDRRGAKVWSLVMNGKYFWGSNLWHSTAIRLMSFDELKRTFGHRRVLLFDEMMQSGREMNALRRYLERVNAEVSGFVSVRRKSYVEEGNLLEYEAEVCEDLEETEFFKRATEISQLMIFMAPPLDVDHVVIKGWLLNEFDEGIGLLERLSAWGLVSIVRHPEDMNNLFAITLDRPQFFDTGKIDLGDKLSISWDGPCKVRLYVNPETRECFCSFIVFPEISGPPSSWAAVDAEIMDKGNLFDDATERYRRAYVRICCDLALHLLDDFVSKGVASDIGIRIDAAANSVDKGQLIATFGPKTGIKIYSKIERIVTNGSSCLFNESMTTPPSLLIREAGPFVLYNYDLLACRTEVLKALLHPVPGSNVPAVPVSYRELIQRLDNFSESTIGKVLDFELDWGTVKPMVQVNLSTTEAVVRRSFLRGEYGPYFEWESDVHTQEDEVIQKTVAIAPFVVEQFLRRTGEKQMTATHITKVFSNLCHDWLKASGKLYLGWRAYKFGAIAIAPKTNELGEYEQFERFLVNIGCLEKTDEKHKTQVWKRYSLPGVPNMDWRALYEKRIDPATRSHVSGLVRLYAQIKKDCEVPRISTQHPSQTYHRGDSLVVLASVRNEKTAYRCGWFEVNDWVQKGMVLLSNIKNLALQEWNSTKPNWKRFLEDFASPASLLFEKIEMYKAVPLLREQIVNLMDKYDLEAANVVLATVDKVPIIRTDSDYPVKELELAARVMRAFSSFLRQIMTLNGFEEETRNIRRIQENGITKDVHFYLKELLVSWEGLTVLRGDLNKCIAEAELGKLSVETADCLYKTFNLIASNLKQRLKDPRKPYEISKERRNRIEGFQMRLRDIHIQNPYVVGVLDIYNLIHLLDIAYIFGVPYETAMDGFLGWVDNTVREFCTEYPSITYGGLINDNLIFACSNPDDLFIAISALEKKVSDKLFKIDERFLSLGLFRTGLAWHDKEMGPDFAGVKPGLTALKIGDRQKRPPGSIVATKEVFARLSPEVQITLQEEREADNVVYVFRVGIEATKVA